MGDINFLSSQKGSKKEKKKEPLKKIEWTTPVETEAETKKEANSPFFSLLKKGNSPENKMKQSREAVLRTIGEKEEIKKSDSVPEPKDVKEIKKPEIVMKKVEENKGLKLKKIESPRPVKRREKTDLNMAKPEPEPIKAEVGTTPTREKDIDPRRINFFNRLIDSWRKYLKNRQERKNVVELIPDSPKKEEKLPTGEGSKNEKKEIKPQNGKESKKNPDSKALINSNVLETNLIKGENVLHFIDWQKNSVILALFGFFAVFIVAGSYFWLTLLEKEVKSQVADADKKISELNGSIEKIKKDIQEFSVLEKKVKLLSQLLDSHVRWTNFFSFLEANTLEEIYYSDGFSGDSSGNYTIPAKAENFNSISEQLKVFKRNDLVRSVSTKGGKISSEAEKSAGVGFDLQISVDPKLFTNFPK